MNKFLELDRINIDNLKLITTNNIKILERIYPLLNDQQYANVIYYSIMGGHKTIFNFNWEIIDKFLEEVFENKWDITNVPSRKTKKNGENRGIIKKYDTQ